MAREREGSGSVGGWGKEREGRVYVVPCFGFCVARVSIEYGWCDVVYKCVIHFRRRMRVLGIGGGFENRGKKVDIGSMAREWAKKSKHLSRPPQECGVPLSSITLSSNSEGLIKGLSNQGSSGDILWGVIQKI